MTTKLTPGDRQSIRWVIGRLHVASTDKEVEDNITKRCQKAKWTEAQTKAACAYALKVHHDNQGIVKKFHL